MKAFRMRKCKRKVKNHFEMVTHMENEILNYAEYLFSAALKKCGSIEDAQDLTQEVLLAAYVYEGRGGEIANTKAWLSSTLNHKWGDFLRRKYKLPTVSIDMLPEESGEGPAAELSEETAPTPGQVRREVAYLAELQREVVVKHYFQGQRVQAIADELGVPKGTVLSRLSSGREQMRKGLESMEQYERQSYIPEHLDVTCNGRPGMHDEPWSLVADDLMKQNILIIAYEKPLTVVEIAKALGIPTPYIENAVNELVRSELMCRNGNRVFTDFMIVTPKQLDQCLDAALLLAREHYADIWERIQALFDELRGMGWYDGLHPREKIMLEYYAALHVFSCGIHQALGRIVDVHEEYPVRPDGGAWAAQGIRRAADFDLENWRFRQYCYGGERKVCFENFLNEKFIALHVYDTQPDLNRYEHGPVEIHDDNLCKLLYIIYQGIPFDAVGFNTMFLEDIPHLADCGILRYEDGLPCVAVPVIKKAQYDELARIAAAHAFCLAGRLEQPLREAFPRLKLDIPKHLSGRVALFRQYSCYAIPMCVVKQAIARGDFLNGVDYPTPPMVLVTA